MIIRTVHNRENPYVMVNKAIVNDPRLSLKALGLWIKCMSKPDNWKFHVSALVKELKEGKTAIYSALDELIEAGYCIRGQRRATEDGRFESVEYVMYEFPATEEDKQILEEYFKNSLPRSGFPQPGFPHAENQPLINTDSHQVKTDKEHICPAGVDAPCSGTEELDELGNPVFHEKLILKGELKRKYESLTDAQKRAVKLLRNVPPVNDQDERFELVTAINLASHVSMDRLRKSILVYQQRLKRGERPRKMGAYLKQIIDQGYEPEPEHAETNKQTWKNKKRQFAEGSYLENRDYVEFPRIGREVTWRMSPEVFEDQLNRIVEILRNS